MNAYENWIIFEIYIISTELPQNCCFPFRVIRFSNCLIFDTFSVNKAIVYAVSSHYGMTFTSLLKSSYSIWKLFSLGLCCIEIVTHKPTMSPSTIQGSSVLVECCQFKGGEIVTQKFPFQKHLPRKNVVFAACKDTSDCWSLDVYMVRVRPIGSL